MRPLNPTGFPTIIRYPIIYVATTLYASFPLERSSIAESKRVAKIPPLVEEEVDTRGATFAQRGEGNIYYYQREAQLQERGKK